MKCSFRNEIAPGAATTTAQFILRFGLVAVMLVGGILVTAGSLSIPMFILFLLFAGRIYDPFTSCFMLMAEVFSALVSVKRMKPLPWAAWMSKWFLGCGLRNLKLNVIALVIADIGAGLLRGCVDLLLEPETLFKNYAIVFQDVMLFDETVMENIRLGRGDATDEEVMAAAKAAQCEEFI